MGQQLAFLQIQRAASHERAPLERVRDWFEFHDPMPEPVLKEQGSRCMDCGLPFCHTGASIAGMASGCPLHNLIPEWNDLVYRDRWSEAFERLDATNNFPEFTGRVCPAPCEGSCVLGMAGQPVAIKQIEKSIVERAFTDGLITPRVPTVRTGGTVAVVGSGPAGLACADELNQAGHTVTVFERADRVGGLLMYGIPNMKLDKSVVQRRVDLLAAEGITFRTGVEVGRDLPAKTLRDSFDAVVLCVGSTKPRDLPVPGRDLGGVHFAMDFLRANTQTVLADGTPVPGFISAKDRDVIVIGGGDTGTDCVGTALRMGCRSLVQFEILPKQPTERAPDNPWPQWPKVHRTDYGQEEAAALFGRDPRNFCIVTKRFLADAAGHVRGVETIQVEWKRGADGRFGMVETPGTEKTWKADLVLLALGFVGPERSRLLEDLGVGFDPRGNVAAGTTKMTTVPGVFAAGDAARGQSLVVWAIAEGRTAAAGVDAFLAARSPSGAVPTEFKSTAL
jgi:glutamate synthase (NADPH) small chain